MAETDSAGCRCSNISIMQLFHELKQRFPKVPDQIVSKVIQQNFHDKTACETLLQRENNLYVQCYPGALISGDGRSQGPQGPISDHCSAGPPQSPKSQQPPRPPSETVCRDPQASPLQQTSADKVTATALPTSQQQTDSDVSTELPLSTAHASKALTPPRELSHSAPPSSRGTPDEDDFSSTDDNPDATSPDPGGNTAIPSDDPPPSSKDVTSCPRLRSLEEKLELAKIPLGQLVREARERLTERAGSEQKKGCEVSECSDVPPSVVDCEPRLVAPVTSLSEVVESACDQSPRRLSVTSDESSCSKSSTPTPAPSIEGTPSRLVDKRRTEKLCTPPRDSPSNANPEYAPPKRPTTLPCDISRKPQHTLLQPPPIPRDESHTNIRAPPSPETSPNRPQPSSGNLLSSPNRLVPPAFSNPFLSPAFANRWPTPSNDLSANRPPHRSSDTSPSGQTSGPFPRTQPSEAPKEYEVAVECLVCPGTPGDQQRSFTSVNLTLRPPSAETTLPIDISSGQSLTYTSASFDPRQGYQSHLQIRIGPAGGSVTASRTRVTSPIVRTASRSPCRAGTVCQSRHHVRALLQQQRERKELLARELRREKERLRAMQAQVHAMKLALARAASRPLVLSKLKADIERLRAECERLTAAVDSFTDQNNQNNLPLGETDEDFYRNIYTGQRHLRAGWSCRVCTFRNHPLLSVCEECEMPRLSLGTLNNLNTPTVLSNPVFANNNSSCAVGETSTSVSRTITPLQER